MTVLEAHHLRFVEYNGQHIINKRIHAEQLITMLSIFLRKTNTRRPGLRSPSQLQGFFWRAQCQLLLLLRVGIRNGDGQVPNMTM